MNVKEIRSAMKRKAQQDIYEKKILKFIRKEFYDSPISVENMMH